MSSTATRMPLAEGMRLAERFIERIGPYCQRVQVAGSIRRRAATVGDIEVVCVPTVASQPALDMFGETVSTGTLDLLDQKLTEMLALEDVTKRLRSDGKTVWGQKMKYLTVEGVNVDLFTPEAARFGLILMIRTGPAAYSHQLVTERGKQIVGHRPDGAAIKRTGLLPSHLRVVEGWLTSRVAGIRIPTPEEKDFYEHTRLPYVEPWERR